MSFLFRGKKIGEIIPFPVWLIPFPVLIIPFPVLIIPFPVFELVCISLIHYLWGLGHRTRSKMFETTNTIGRVGCAGYVVGGSVAQAMWWVGRLRRLCGNYSDNNATSWLHLASWNLPDSQLSWESKMEPSVAISLSDDNSWLFLNIYIKQDFNISKF